jgi:membrane-bound ClpP family serine protease
MIRSATGPESRDPRRFARGPAGAGVRARGGWLWALALAGVAAAGAPARAEGQPRSGLYAEMPADVTRAKTRLYTAVEKAFEKRDGKAKTFTLLYNFNPNGRKTESDDFGSCYSLAEYLRELNLKKGVRTVAFVDGVVGGHCVAPLLACRQVVVANREGASFGKVTTPDRPLKKVERDYYLDITRGRFKPVIVRKMFDADLAVVKAGNDYRDADEKPRPRGDEVPGLGKGQITGYTFVQALELGLCEPGSYTALNQVVTAYNVPSAGPGAVDHSVCYRIPIKGPITNDVPERVKRRVAKALRNRATVLVFELACRGGSDGAAYEVGDYLAKLNDNRDNPVETIAYVTREASDLAAYIAFGCDRIIMQNPEGEGADRREGARLGNFENYLKGHPEVEAIGKRLDRVLDPQERKRLEGEQHEAETELARRLSKSLADLAKRRHPALLAEGMLNKELRIREVEWARGSTGGTFFVSGEEWREDQSGPRKYRGISVVKPATDQYLTLTADQSVRYGVAVAKVKDFDELKAREGIDEVRTIEDDWLEGLADFLRDPWTSVILVMLGITCLILEMKMPGVGLPGVIAAICFVLFFWSHSQLNGQITWLAVLLFVLGLLLIGLEVFVLPGFGVAGISGILLVLASLGLVAYGHWPRSNDEWVKFGQKIGPFGVSMLGALVAVAIIVRYLPHIPVLNRLMLRTQEEGGDGGGTLADNPAHAELAGLLGAIGVAATPLRPAGKVQIGDAFIDVMADGGYIMPGTRVQVVEVEGNRVVVKPV